MHTVIHVLSSQMKSSWSRNKSRLDTVIHLLWSTQGTRRMKLLPLWAATLVMKFPLA